MSDKEAPQGKLTRRTLIKGAGAGLCLFYLSSLIGCGESELGQPHDADPSERATEKVKGSLLGQQKGFINPVPARWFTEIGGSTIQCHLCPRECKLKRGERSPCRVRENREGQGYTLAYGNPALFQEDPIERLPFFHVVPGSRALSVSTAGCNLECRFCEVWDMALEYPEEVYAHDMPPEKVIAHAKESNVRSISYAFGEPAIFFEYMEKIATLASEAGLLNLIHTAAYMKLEPLKDLVKFADAVNVDLKGFDERFYRTMVGGELAPVLDALKLFRKEGVHVEITNILIPDQNDDLSMIKHMCEWIAAELGTETPLHFARFYPLYKLSELPRTPVSTMEKARDIALDVGIKFPYIARVSHHEGENTFCPGCGQKIIDRVGFMIDEMHIVDGRCAFCNTVIPGKWV